MSHSTGNADLREVVYVYNSRNSILQKNGFKVENVSNSVVNIKVPLEYGIPSKFINIPQAQMKISHESSGDKTNTGCLLECASANLLAHAKYQLDLPGPRDILDILVFQVFWDLLDHLSQCDPSAIP